MSHSGSVGIGLGSVSVSRFVEVGQLMAPLFRIYTGMTRRIDAMPGCAELRRRGSQIDHWLSYRPSMRSEDLSK